MRAFCVPADGAPEKSAVLFMDSGLGSKVEKIVVMDSKGGKMRITRKFKDEGKRTMKQSMPRGGR